MSDEGPFQVWLIQSLDPGWMGDLYAVLPEWMGELAIRLGILSQCPVADLRISLASEQPTDLKSANLSAWRLSDENRRLLTQWFPPLPETKIAWSDIAVQDYRIAVPEMLKP